MKTTYLKFEVIGLSFLVIANVLCLLAACLIDKSFFFFIGILSFIGGPVQVIGSGINLQLNHKSIGFVKWRRLHFWSSLIVVVFLFGRSAFVSAVFFYILLFIMLQLSLYAYYILDIRELRYLQNREAAILR